MYALSDQCGICGSELDITSSRCWAVTDNNTRITAQFVNKDGKRVDICFPCHNYNISYLYDEVKSGNRTIDVSNCTPPKPVLEKCGVCNTTLYLSSWRCWAISNANTKAQFVDSIRQPVISTVPLCKLCYINNIEYLHSELHNGKTLIDISECKPVELTAELNGHDLACVSTLAPIGIKV